MRVSNSSSSLRRRSYSNSLIRVPISWLATAPREVSSLPSITRSVRSSKSACNCLPTLEALALPPWPRPSGASLSSRERATSSRSAAGLRLPYTGSHSASLRSIWPSTRLPPPPGCLSHFLLSSLSSFRSLLPSTFFTPLLPAFPSTCLQQPAALLATDEHHPSTRKQRPRPAD